MTNEIDHHVENCSLALTSRQVLIRIVAVLLLSFSTVGILFAQANIPLGAAIEYSNNKINSNSSPALAVFNGFLYVAYWNTSGVLVTSTMSTPGGSLTPEHSTGVSGGPIASGGVAMVAFGPKLYIVYPTGHGQDVISSADGSTWTSPTTFGAANVGDIGAYGVGLTVFNNRMYVAFIGNGPTVYVTSSADGTNFSSAVQVSTIPFGGISTSWVFSPSITSLASTLTVTWTTVSGTGYLASAISTNGGSTWQSAEFTSSRFNHDTAVSFWNNNFYVAGQSAYSEHNLWIAGSTTGLNWNAASNYGATFNNSPGVANWNGTYCIGFRSNYGNQLWMQFS